MAGHNEISVLDQVKRNHYGFFLFNSGQEMTHLTGKTVNVTLIEPLKG